MKKLRLIIFIFLITIVPINIYAYDGATDKLFINIDILESGDINVAELASLKGTYNGRLRDIIYADNTLDMFTGSDSSFEGSLIYNGSSIENLEVYSVAGRNTITFDSLFDTSKRSDAFTQVERATNGTSGVYFRNDLTNGVDLKIYNSSNTNTAFLITYTIKDVVVVHNDIAEIAWKILGDSYDDDIDYMEVHINLPSTDKDLRVWLHGPLNGNIERVDGKYAKIVYDELPKNNYVSARLAFNKDLVPNATKLSNVNGLDKILKVEEEWAEEANAVRNRVKLEYYTIFGLTILYLITIIIMSIILSIKHKKNLKTTFEMEYLREFPREYGPEILQYLIYNNIDEKSFSASLLMIIEKKALKVEKDMNSKKKDAYTLIKEEKYVKDLTEREKETLTLVIDTIGNGEKTTLKELKEYGNKISNANNMMHKFRAWQKNAVEDAQKEDFYIKKVPFKNKMYILILIGILLSIINIILDVNTLLGIITIIISIIIFVITLSTVFRTEKGALEYNQWYALKRFMLDFGDMDVKELPEVSVWGKYLVYATVLGCAKKLEKTMKIRIKDMNINDNLTDYYLYHNFTDDILITNILTDSMNSAFSVSKSSIARSESSSGSGSGGGASFGGGSFGGGGGGGHF